MERAGFTHWREGPEFKMTNRQFLRYNSGGKDGAANVAGVRKETVRSKAFNVYIEQHGSQVNKPDI